MKIKIYQANEPTFRVDEDVKVYDKSLYKQVWETVLPKDNKWTNNNELLEYIFMICNGPHPADYKGHSLSVGDIVELQSDFSGRWTETYICCSTGWMKIKLA